MMDLKTRLEVLPCGKCEDMIGCDNCVFVKEAKELYKQIRADVIDEFKQQALIEFTMFDLEHGYPTIADVKDIIWYLAKRLKEK